MRPMPPYKVLVVDDSRAICAFLVSVLSSDSRLEVVGYALDAFQARDMLQSKQPDVMTLDVEMPHMDGLTFLRKTMRTRPLPVVMMSSLTTKGAAITLDALEAGAVDFVAKRQATDTIDITTYSNDIIRRVCSAATTRVGPWKEESPQAASLPDLLPLQVRLRTTSSVSFNLQKLVALGASTGGPEAFRKLLADFHNPDCALVISQHMPERFMKPFADRLNQASRFLIDIAVDGERIEAGRGYVAPGDKHLEVVRSSDQLFCKISSEETVNGHRPSVDVMFDSVAASVGNASFGVLLTGMGEDGARGLKHLHEIGAPTIVQDRQSSAVWGMPGRADEMGAADQVLSLETIGPALSQVLQGKSMKRVA